MSPSNHSLFSMLKHIDTILMPKLILCICSVVLLFRYSKIITFILNSAKFGWKKLAVCGRVCLSWFTHQKIIIIIDLTAFVFPRFEKELSAFLSVSSLNDRSFTMFSVVFSLFMVDLVYVFVFVYSIIFAVFIQWHCCCYRFIERGREREREKLFLQTVNSHMNFWNHLSQILVKQKQSITLLKCFTKFQIKKKSSNFSKKKQIFWSSILCARAVYGA